MNTQLNIILHAVADIAGVKAEQVRGKRRFRELVLPRQIYAYIGVKKGYTLSEVGRVIGQDHTTVIHSRDTITNYIKVKDYLCMDFIDRLTKKYSFGIDELQADKKYSGEYCTQSQFYIIRS